MLDVTALGELLIDFTLAGTNGEGYPIMEAHPGGAPANFLAALNKFGARTALLGKVGGDAFGRLLTDTVAQMGVETRGIVTDHSVFTTLAFVTLDHNGDRTFSFARKPGADTMLTGEELDLSLIEQARVFHFGTLSLTDEPVRAATHRAVDYARRLGRLITYDPNLRPPLWSSLEEAKRQMLWGLGQADVVKISDEEGEFLFGCGAADAAARILKEYDVKLVFVTLGKDGCYFANRRACGYVPGLPGIKVVDTTGAGDIFGGTAVWKLLQTGKSPEELTGAELRNIGRFACGAASLSTQQRGGLGSVPEQAQVEALLLQYPLAD